MTEGKTVCPPPLCGRGIKKKKIHNTFNSFPFIILMSNVRTFLHRPNCQNCWPCHVQWLVYLKTLNLWSRHKFHIPIYKGLFSIKIKAEIYMCIPLHSLFYIIWRCFIILQILWTYPGSFKLRSSPTYLHKAVGNSYKGIHSHLSLVFFLFFPENRLWYFMHIVIQGYNCLEMPKPIFWEIQEHACISNLTSAEFAHRVNFYHILCSGFEIMEKNNNTKTN